MKVLLAMMALFVMFAVGRWDGYNNGVEHTKLVYAADSVATYELDVTKHTMLTAGLEETVKWCKDRHTSTTDQGTLYFTCSISGDFLETDPKPRPVGVRGPDIIVPTGVYIGIENGLSLLARGYKLKAVDVCVRVFKQDPTDNSSKNPVIVSRDDRLYEGSWR